MAFWACLLAAAVLYGAVALAPPFLAGERLSAEHYARQVRLVALEREIAQLSRVSAALASEPAYAAELARIDFRAPLLAADTIAVDPPLQLHGAPRTGPLAAPDEARKAMPASEPAAFRLLVEPFATDMRVRRGTLAAAALLIVFAFGFLHGAHTEQARAASRGLRLAAHGLIGRYRRRAG